MDPTTVCCPNTHCHARGQTGQGNIGIHAQKEQRCICHACHTTFSATTGTVFSRLRTSGRDRGDGRDRARPRVSRASDRGGVGVRPWRQVCLAPVVKRYERRRVVAIERRLVDGAPARVETLRRRSHGDGVINTATAWQKATMSCPRHLLLHRQ